MACVLNGYYLFSDPLEYSISKEEMSICEVTFLLSHTISSSSSVLFILTDNSPESLGEKGLSPYLSPESLSVEDAKG